MASSQRRDQVPVDALAVFVESEIFHCELEMLGHEHGQPHGLRTHLAAFDATKNQEPLNLRMHPQRENQIRRRQRRLRSEQAHRHGGRRIHRQGLAVLRGFSQNTLARPKAQLRQLLRR